MKQIANLSEATPAEIDTVWCQHLEARNRATGRIDSWRKRLTADDGRRFRSDYEYPVGRTMTDYHEAKAKAEAEIAEADAAIAPLQAEYERRGKWTRFLVVPGGHFHRFGHCSSFRWTTARLWTPTLSGKTDAEIVAELDERACTKCFPDAPVAARNGPTVKEGQCPGSVFYVPHDERMIEKTFAKRDRYTGEIVRKTRKVWRSNYRCPDCGKVVSVGQDGKLRAHKAPKVKK